MDSVRKQFEILNDGLVYLDSASTTQKPKVVVDSLVQTYIQYNANVHRGMYPLAIEADKRWTDAHEKVANFINADWDEVFFTRNATEGLNWLALTYTEQFLKKGDVVAVSKYEHHSNLLPWRKCEKEGIRMEIFSDEAELEKLFEKHGDNLKLVSVVHMSNVTGKIFDIKRISKTVHSHNGILAVDGTQSIAHMNIDVKDLDCDFYIFSGHKIYGPNGVGVVWGKRSLLQVIDPIFQGGEMVESVSSEIKYSKLPFKFEAGTPNIADGIALGAAIDWVMGIEGKYEYLDQLSNYLYREASKIKNIKIISEPNSSIFAFNIPNVHPHDVASDLGELGICVRAGYHCVQPLHESLGLKGSVRVSLGLYNDKNDIDKFVKSMNSIINKYE